MVLSPSQELVLHALACGGPVLASELRRSVSRNQYTIRDARAALEAGDLVIRSGQGRAIAYALTEKGKALVASMGPCQGPPMAPPIETTPRTTPDTPRLSREFSGKSQNGNERTAAAASKPPARTTPRTTPEDEEQPQGPPHEPLEALEWMSRYAKRLERDRLMTGAALELALSRIAELERRLAERVSPEKAVVAQTARPLSEPEPAKAPSRQLDRAPTSEEVKEALDDRVDEQRSKGFKTGEAEFRNFMRREYRDKPWEVFEQLDVKREREDVRSARTKAAAIEKSERAAQEAQERARRALPATEAERVARVRACMAGLAKLDPERRADIGARAEEAAREEGIRPSSGKWDVRVGDLAREIFEKEHGSKLEPSGARP